jgi:Putative periplasmic protein kinase ArgK and related GTPases of G3E family
MATSTLDGKNISDLWEAIKKHRDHMVDTGTYREAMEKRLRLEVTDIIQRKLMEIIERDLLSSGRMNTLTEKLVNREIDPYAAANDLLKKFYPERRRPHVR